MLKLRNSIHSKYNLNVTKFKTLPSLALAIYTTKYLPNNLVPEFKMIKGGLENKIRTSYSGGNVDVFINQISNGYLYDMNSQYSKAMMNDMPIGDPVLSLDTNLDNIFGFVYAEIICPSESELQVPFIQYKDSIFSYNSCPRGKFKRLIFSEEAKYAVKYGYKIKVEYSYKFKKGKDLFKSYVLAHYELKKNSKDPIQKNIAKLFLNSLYGRLGMNETGDHLEIVSKESMKSLDKHTYVSIISELGENKYLVKYSGIMDDSVTDLYSKDITPSDLSKVKKNKKGELKKLGLNKSKNISSAVHVAAAISSYARILINEYKNIPGNPCIMSDTDSAVLSYPLPDHLVGDGLGQMKLVHEIKQGIFIKKKLYCILTKDNKTIIKASGLDSSKLNYNSFEQLLKGESIEIINTNFNVDWKTLNVNVEESKRIVKGLYGKIKTIYNTPDVNFKFISFSVKYNLIIHPLYPMIADQKKDLILELVDPQETISFSNNDSDVYLLFSKFEIILFIISLFILLIVIITYTFYYK